MKILRRLLPYTRPLHHFLPEYGIYTFFSIIFGLLNITMLIPLLGLLFQQETIPVTVKPVFHFSIDFFKDFFNYYFTSIIHEHNKFYALVFVCIIICISVILSNVFKYLSIKVMIRFRLKVLGGLRNSLYDKYIQQSLSYHHNKSKAELLMTMTNEVQEIESSVLNSFQVLLRDPFFVIAYFGVLMYWSVKLTLFLLIFLPITGLVIGGLTKKLKKFSYFSADKLNRLLGITEESISGIRPLQSFTAEPAMTEKFRGMNDEYSIETKRLAGRRELASPVSEALGVIAAICLVVFGGGLILYHATSLTGQGFITYLVLYTQLIQPLKNISAVSSTLQRGIVATEKIFAVLDNGVTITDKPDAIAKTNFNDNIKIENLSFSYGNADVLSGINLEIDKGRTVALVGQSGSGKSTLIDLVCRFYDVQQGAIKIDGTNIADIKLNNLRSLVSVVSQDNFLFNDTIASNIALSNPGATREQIETAAKIANAHEFIMAMPEGYDTVTGERGVKLSGGQRQRITIARAILKNSPIIILDEATSALDTESERLVQDAINNMMKSRTSIVIAHRLSTVRHADEIIVLQNGKIVERGNHDALLAMDGYYKKLVDLQEVK